MLPSVLPRLATDSAVRMFPGVWKPLFLRVSSWDGISFLGRDFLPGTELPPYLLCPFFHLLYFFLPISEANDLLCWVPDVLCQHSEVVLWNLLSAEMFFWWIFEGESGLPILFLHHLRTAPLIFILNDTIRCAITIPKYVYNGFIITLCKLSQFIWFSSPTPITQYFTKSYITFMH